MPVSVSYVIVLCVDGDPVVYFCRRRPKLVSSLCCSMSYGLNSFGVMTLHKQMAELSL